MRRLSTVAGVLLLAGGLTAVVPTGRDPIAHASSVTDIPAPPGSGLFGQRVLVLTNGNYVIADPLFSTGGVAAVGAVYLYDGGTNTIISRLTGSSANDEVGGGGFLEVGASNVLVRSPGWANGAASDAGAITWMSGLTGVNGAVSPTNSLVGSSTDDRVGFQLLTPLANGNWVARTPLWNRGGIADAGAATWGRGNAETVGAVGTANSIVGSRAGDEVSSAGVVALTNGNYLVGSPKWDLSAAVTDAGAATWGNGAIGTAVETSGANSFVGARVGDGVGLILRSLTNGNYVVGSPNWDTAFVTGAGAVTWGNGSSGSNGTVTAANSLVGSSMSDVVGFVITPLTNGNYVVNSTLWDRTGLVVPDVGAVTWGNGSTGSVVGAISTLNSLVGSRPDDQVGNLGVVALENGNAVAASPLWDDGALVDAGAATWLSGTGPTVGSPSAANSLVGLTAGDRVASSVVALTNGNYVVSSPSWSNVGAPEAGAVTWGNGTTGVVGHISAANSLIGVTAGSRVGHNNAAALTNGNYVVRSQFWNGGGIATAGAATWGNGATGTTGAVTSANSLVGTQTEDRVGSFIHVLANGNYVLRTPTWNNGAVVDAGAVTWGNGSTGTSGVVSTANSIFGTTANDNVGRILVPLTSGDYAVGSQDWDNVGAVDAGAATYARGTMSSAGPVSALNSLVGTVTNNLVGDAVLARPDGMYVVRSIAIGPNGGAAFTLGVPGGTRGFISPQNSVIATTFISIGGMDVSTRFTSGTALVAVVPDENRVALLAPFDFVPVAPARLADTRAGAATIDGIAAGSGIRGAGQTTELQVTGRGGVPAVAAAVALNVTVTEPEVALFVTVFPCGEPRPTASSLNAVAGATVPNAVIAKVGAGGKVCLFTSQATHLVVDVTGYFPGASAFRGTNPARLVDTRPGAATVDGQQAGSGLIAAGSILSVQVAGRAGTPIDAEAVVLNITVTEAAADGFVTVFACGKPRPTASSLNATAGGTVANLVVAKLGTGGTVCIFNQSATHLVVDVNGYFPALTSFTSRDPARLQDTRAGSTTVDGQGAGGGPQPAGTTLVVQVAGRGGVAPDGVSVVLNVTVTEPSVAGFVTVFPCGITPPLASNLNFAAGQTIPNAVLVKIGSNGTVCLFTSQATHLVVDVNGYFQS